MKIPRLKGLSHRGTERRVRKAAYRSRVRAAGSRSKMRRSYNSTGR